MAARCLLVIVECRSDKAVTELLKPGDQVPIMDLVPFDNNIAMRGIVTLTDVRRGSNAVP
jgi:hypothetical protein